MENVFLIDWLTFTIRASTVDQVKSFIGMAHDSIKWEILGGCNGYPESVNYNGIRIMYGASEDMGVCVNMSGQGCRSYESFGGNDWSYLFDMLCRFTDSGTVNVTRLDLAFDDHNDLLDIQRIKADTDAGNWTAKFRWWTCQYGSEGTSLYYGSPQSNIRCRIYDKAAERGLDDHHWVRVELQLRKGNALTAVQHINSGMSIGTVFSGVLRNYLQFREPYDYDSNKSRWPLADYWSEFLDGAVPVTLWVNPGCEYNLEKLQRFVIDQAGNAISCYVLIHGYEGLRYFLDTYKKKSTLPAKYKLLLDLAARGDGGFVYDEETD